MPLCPDRIKKDADDFVRENPDAAVPIIELLDAVADPRGDSDRYRLAWEIIRRLYVHTDHFEASCKEFLTSLHVGEKEDDNEASALLSTGLDGSCH